MKPGISVGKGEKKKTNAKKLVIYGKGDADMERVKSFCSEQQVSTSARKSRSSLYMLPTEGSAQNLKIKQMHRDFNLFHCFWLA